MAKESHVELGNLAVDFQRYTVRIENHLVDLTYQEFEALRCLLEHRGVVVSRDQLLKSLWGDGHAPEQVLHRRLNTQISRLRHQLAESEPWKIQTVAKRGYMLSEDAMGDEE